MKYFLIMWELWVQCFSSIIQFLSKIWTSQQLVCNDTQCVNYRIFMSVRFYVKSILGILEVIDLPFYLAHLEALIFEMLWIFALYESWNLPNQQNSEPLKLQKWQFYNFSILQNWFQLKSEWQKTPDIFTMLYEQFNTIRIFCHIYWSAKKFQVGHGTRFSTNLYVFLFEGLTATPSILG